MLIFAGRQYLLAFRKEVSSSSEAACKLWKQGGGVSSDLSLQRDWTA